MKAQFLRSYRYRDSLCATSLDVLEAGGLLPPRMAAQPAAVTVGRQPLLRTGPPPSLSGPWSWQSWGFELVVRSNKGRLKLKRKYIFILMVLELNIKLKTSCTFFALLAAFHLLSEPLIVHVFIVRLK